MQYFDDTESPITDIEYQSLINSGIKFRRIGDDLYQFKPEDIAQANVDILYNEAASLELIAGEKRKELESAYIHATENGFESSALGTPHAYKSHGVAQLDLIGLKACNRPRKVWCANVDIWEMRLHTAAQIEDVINDGADIKEAAFLNLTAKLAEIETIMAGQDALEVKTAAINAIVW